MPTFALSIGVPTVLATNQIYALPIAKTSVYSDAAATMEQSNDFTFTAKQAVTLTAGVSALHGAYLRATTGTPTIILKKG